MSALPVAGAWIDGILFSSRMIGVRCFLQRRFFIEG
jgi:hypothetical protein